MDRLNFGTPSLSIDLVKGTTILNGRSIDQTIGNLDSFTYVPRNTEVSTKKNTAAPCHSFLFQYTNFFSFFLGEFGRNLVRSVESYGSHIWQWEHYREWFLPYPHDCTSGHGRS